MGIVGLCSDHAGFELKEYIKTILDERGLSYKDFGTYSSDSCDYPDFAHLMGKEIEVDAVCDGEDILIPGIMEHIERAGIHSGDSISVYPAQTISEKIQNVLVDYTRKLARSLHVIGLINIQFIVYQDDRSKSSFQPNRSIYQ